MSNKEDTICNNFGWSSICPNECEAPYMHTHQTREQRKQLCDICDEPMSFQSECWGHTMTPFQQDGYESTEAVWTNFNCSRDGNKCVTRLINPRPISSA